MQMTHCTHIPSQVVMAANTWPGASQCVCSIPSNLFTFSLRNVFGSCYYTMLLVWQLLTSSMQTTPIELTQTTEGESGDIDRSSVPPA